MAKMFGYRARTWTLRLVRATLLAIALIMLSPVTGLITGELSGGTVDEPLNVASQVVVPNQTVIFKTL